MIRRWGTLVCAVLWLAGCAAPPAVHYYSLAATGASLPAPGATAASGAARAASGLRLEVTGIPAQVERPQLVVQEAATDPAVQVLNGSLWSAPLRDQLQARLGREVAAVLGVPNLDGLPEAADLPARRVMLQVTRFDLRWQQGAVLQARWTDRAPQAGAARVCHAAVEQPATEPGVAGLVRAQQRALQVLARLIAQGRPAGGSPEGQGVSQFGCTL